MRGHPSAIARQPPYRSRASPKSAEHTTRHGARSRSVRRAVSWAGTDAYVALELGERFLPRPTTTFTKRRLYCGRSGRRTGGVSVAIGEVPGEAGIEPKARNRNGDSAYLETLDGATLGELLLVLLGDLGGLTANLTGTSEGTVDLAHLVLRCVMRTPERPSAQKPATANAERNRRHFFPIPAILFLWRESTFLRSEAGKLARNLGDVAVCDDVAVLEFLNERIAQTTRK